MSDEDNVDLYHLSFEGWLRHRLRRLRRWLRGPKPRFKHTLTQIIGGLSLFAIPTSTILAMFCLFEGSWRWASLYLFFAAAAAITVAFLAETQRFTG